MKNEHKKFLEKNPGVVRQLELTDEKKNFSIVKYIGFYCSDWHIDPQKLLYSDGQKIKRKVPLSKENPKFVVFDRGRLLNLEDYDNCEIETDYSHEKSLFSTKVPGIFVDRSGHKINVVGRTGWYFSKKEYWLYKKILCLLVCGILFGFFSVIRVNMMKTKTYTKYINLISALNTVFSFIYFDTNFTISAGDSLRGIHHEFWRTKIIIIIMILIIGLFYEFYFFIFSCLEIRNLPIIVADFFTVFMCGTHIYKKRKPYNFLYI